MAKTIKEMADTHVGHSEEIDEDSVITAQRESYKWGAYAILKEIEDCMSYAVEYPLTYEEQIQEIRKRIKELSGEQYADYIQ